MSQVNSPRVEHQIPDIGMTAYLRENYDLKGKLRSQKEDTSTTWEKKKKD